MMWWWRARRGRNPLLQRPAPAERAVAAGVAALGMLLAAGVAGVAMLTFAVANRVAATQRDAHHMVRATVVQVTDPVSTPGTYVSAEGALPFREHLQWQWQGQTHTGTTMATVPQAAPGGKQIWVDDAGKLTSPPLRPGDAIATSVIATLGAAIMAIGLLITAVQLRRGWMLRRRLRCWEHEWERIGPLWTGYSDRY